MRRCSFCGKPQGEVRLVAGPADVYICHLCVALCNEVLAHDLPGDRTSPLEGPGGTEGRTPLVRTEITSS